MIAVKMLVALMPSFRKQFENLVYHLMRLKHPNIVRCVGYCYEIQNTCLMNNGKYIFADTAERLLCLEYLPNGSLDKHLAGIYASSIWDVSCFSILFHRSSRLQFVWFVSIAPSTRLLFFFTLVRYPCVATEIQT